MIQNRKRQNSILPPIFFGVGFFNKLSGMGMRSPWWGAPLEASLVPLPLSVRRFGDFRLALAAAGMPEAKVASVAKSKHESKRVEHFSFIFCFILNFFASLKNSHHVQTFKLLAKLAVIEISLESIQLRFILLVLTSAGFTNLCFHPWLRFFQETKS